MKKLRSKKLILGGFCLVLIAMITTLFLNSYSIQETVRSITFTSSRLGYSKKESGSFQVTKSAEWISKEKVKITLDIDTVPFSSDRERNLVLILDTSNSMKEDLEEIKRSMILLVNTFLVNNQNKMALIDLNETSSIVSLLTNDKEAITNKIEGITVSSENRNYYQSFVNVDTVLNHTDEETTVLWITGGYPNKETPNEVSQYRYLKEQYPNLTIYGLQYELGDSILEPISSISDQQYLVTKENLTKVLLSTSNFSKKYQEFILKDMVDTTYFDLNTITNIKVTEGTSTVNEDEVIWNLEGLRSGKQETLTFEVSLKDEWKEETGTISTNTQEEVTYEIEGTSETVRSTKTPILGTHYEVSYEGNAPKGCTVENIPEAKTYRVYDTVEVSKEIPICEGYQFEGWRHVTSGVEQVSESMFQMPESDVVLRATWSKFSIAMSLDGQVTNYAKPVLQSVSENYTGEIWGYKEEIKKIVIQDYIKEIPNAIQVFDISEEKNGGVLAYIVEENGGYTVYIQGDGKIQTNPDSSNLFNGFTNLETIEGLENLDTSNTTNMSNMFKGCSSLTEIDVSHFDTSNVTDMSGMFEGCTNVTELDVSDFDTSKVTDMSNMFKDCNSLTNLDVSHFNTSNVTDMSGMFEGCTNVTELDVSHFDTSKVTDMNNMFKDCNSLTNLDVSNFDTSNVTDMSGMFEGCTNVTELDVSNFDTSKVTDMSNMFKDCNSLTNLDVSNFDTSNVTDMSGMFQGCTNLEEVDFTGIDTSKVQDMGNMFDGCGNLTTVKPENIEVPDGVNTDGIFNGCTNLPEIPIKKTYEVILVTNTNGTITPETLSVDFGKTNTFTVTPNGGYYLSDLSCTNGYTTNAKVGENATDAQTVTVSNNNQNTSSTCTASYEMATYTITYNLNGGIVSGTNPVNLTVDSEPITLLNPTKKGHTFTGWTGSNGTTAQTSVTISTGSFGNKNYTANWKVKSYTVQVKTAGTCTPDKWAAGWQKYINITTTVSVQYGGISDNTRVELLNDVNGGKIIGYNGYSISCTNGYSLSLQYKGNTAYDYLIINNNNNDANSVCIITCK